MKQFTYNCYPEQKKMQQYVHTRGNECERIGGGTEKCNSVPSEYSLEKQSFLRAREQEAS